MSAFDKLIPSAQIAQTLFEQAPVGMLMIDGDGRIHYLNAEAERLFGYAMSELVGRSVDVLVPGRPPLTTYWPWLPKPCVMIAKFLSDDGRTRGQREDAPGLAAGQV